MGTNSSKWDSRAHYAAMSTRKLEELRDWWLAHSQRDTALAREAVAEIRLFIAERIGKKAP